MIKIEVANSLKKDIYRTFKDESIKIINLFESLKENPNKGKLLKIIGTIHLKELKYKSFRFYYIIDGKKLFLFNKKLLEDLLISFIAMSKKNNQQETICKINKLIENLTNSE